MLIKVIFILCLQRCIILSEKIWAIFKNKINTQTVKEHVTFPTPFSKASLFFLIKTKWALGLIKSLDKIRGCKQVCMFVYIEPGGRWGWPKINSLQGYKGMQKKGQSNKPIRYSFLKVEIQGKLKNCVASVCQLRGLTHR